MLVQPAPTGVEREQVSYELQRGQVCMADIHPHDAPLCPRAADFVLTGFDIVCEEPRKLYLCHAHCGGYMRSFRTGAWCKCSEHQGHSFSGISVTRL